MGDLDFHSERRTKGPAKWIPACVDGRCYHRWTPDPFYAIGLHDPIDPATGEPCEVCAACRMERRTKSTGRRRELDSGRVVEVVRPFYLPEWQTVNGLPGLDFWTQKQEADRVVRYRSHVIGDRRSMDETRKIHAEIAGFLARWCPPGSSFRVYCVEPGTSLKHLLTVEYAAPVVQ